MHYFLKDMIVSFSYHRRSRHFFNGIKNTQFCKMRISCAPCAQVLDLAEKYGGHLALSDKKPDKARCPHTKFIILSFILSSALSKLVRARLGGLR